MQVRLTPHSIKDLAWRHVEKLIFAVAFLALVGFAWSALNRQVFSKNPQDLEAGALAVHKKIRDQKWDPMVLPFPEWPKEGEIEFGPSPPPVGPDPNPRIPSFVSVQQLNVTFGRDPFRIKTNGHGNHAQGGAKKPLLRTPQPELPGNAKSERITGYRWAVITALVPIAQQQDLYDRLTHWRDVTSEKNLVRYAGFRIERAEVTRDGVRTAWTPLKLATVLDDMQRWTSQAVEVVSPEAVLPGLTQPLGPNLNGWQPAHVGHPKIPFAVQPGGVAPVQVAPPVDGGEELDFKVRVRKQNAQPLQGPAVAALPFRLFRFFDFTVEPEKSYVYQVQLVLENPNYGVPEDWLADRTSAAKRYADAPWSEPTGVLTVPSDTEVFAGPMSLPWGSRPLSAKVLVRSWNHEGGFYASQEFSATPGDVLNFTDTETVIRDPATQRAIVRKLDFRTNLMLVDIVGARPLAGPALRKPIPSQLFFITSDAQRSVTRFETLDKPAYDALLAERTQLGEEIQPAPQADLLDRPRP